MMIFVPEVKDINLDRGQTGVNCSQTYFTLNSSTLTLSIMRVSCSNFPYLSYGFFILIIIGLLYNILNGREINKSLVKPFLSFSWQSVVSMSFQTLNLRETEQQIEKEDSERVDCLNSLQRTSDEVAKREKLIVELTGKANSLEDIKNKAIVEAKQLRKQLENLEKEKKAKEKKVVPKKAQPI